MKFKELVLFILVVLGIFLIFVFSEIKERFKNIENEKYTIVSNSLKQRVNNLISDKQSTTLAVALALSKNTYIVDSMRSSSFEALSLKEIANDLRVSTNYKNVWIQVLDPNGTSLYRSWTDKTGDNLYNIRADLRELIATKQLNSTISVGIFSMTFKSMVPIFKDEKFIGIIEVITHFNSISKNLELDNIESIVLVDKKFKNQLKSSITKEFIDDYYVTNFENSPEHKSLLIKHGVEKIISNKQYQIIDGKLVTYEYIKGIDGEVLGYYILFKDTKDIEQSDIKAFKFILVLFIIVLILSILILLFLLRNHEKSRIIQTNLELEGKLNQRLNDQIHIITEEKNLNRQILDAQSNLVLLSDGKSLIDANKATFEIISKKDTIEVFLKEQKCICDYFINIKNPEYIVSKYIGEDTWLEYILASKNKQAKSAIEIDGKIHHYKINVSPFVYYGKDIFIVALYDVTHEVEIAQALQNEINEGTKKDLLLQQQSRLAALGEMIGNIAHQWRQPLSAITSAISGLKLKQEYGLLESNDIVQTTDDIIKSANFLSKTIDDFRNFFKKDKKREEFFIDETILNTYDIVKASYMNNQIEAFFDMEHILYYGCPSELSQVILNVLSNAKDALISQTKAEDRVVRVSLKKDFNQIIISIQDNAGGVEEELMEKIFDPYFTTKHQSMGTGLGLYMSSQIIKESFSGNIYCVNNDIEIGKKVYKGANFIIELPLLEVK